MGIDDETHSAIHGTIDTMTRAGETATHRAADAIHRMAGGGPAAGDGVGGTMGGVPDSIGKTLAVSREAQEEAQRKAMLQTRKTMDVMARCGGVLADGWTSVWREWVELTQDVAKRNADGVTTLMRSRSPSDLYAAQSQLLKDNVALVLKRGVRISELSARTADEAAGTLTVNAEAAVPPVQHPGP